MAARLFYSCYGAAILLAAMLVAGTALAADGHNHQHGAQQPAPPATRTTPNLPPDTPGFPSIKGGDFNLVDHTGRARTSRNPEGRPQLLFFGYANCHAICSVALPRIAEAVDALSATGFDVTPVMITVDPDRDTVAALGPALRKIHPNFVGLTGEQDALNAAYKAFQIERKVVFTHPEYGDVYAHGSYIYLLDADGTFRTLLPPVLGPERIAEIVAKYYPPAGG